MNTINLTNDEIKILYHILNEEINSDVINPTNTEEKTYNIAKQIMGKITDSGYVHKKQKIWFTHEINPNPQINWKYVVNVFMGDTLEMQFYSDSLKRISIKKREIRKTFEEWGCIC